MRTLDRSLLFGVLGTLALGSVAAAQRLPRKGEDTQGRALIGDLFGDQSFVDASSLVGPNGLPITHVQVQKGVLSGTMLSTSQGSTFVGTHFQVHTPTAVLTVRIAAIDPVDPAVDQFDESVEAASTTMLYTLKVVQGGGETDFCGADPIKGMHQAIPIAATWNSKGARIDNAVGPKPVFTFACLSGVVAKCYRWGYVPWSTRPDPSQPDQMKNVHQTCTRMARADYCGDGTSHTEPNTPIVLWDHVSENAVRIDLTDEYYAPGGPNYGLTPPKFEAAWATNGARCLSHDRWASMPNTLCVDRNSTPYMTWKPTHNMIGPVGTWVPNICDSDTEALTQSAQSNWGVRTFDRSDINAITVISIGPGGPPNTPVVDPLPPHLAIGAAPISSSAAP